MFLLVNIPLDNGTCDGSETLGKQINMDIFAIKLNNSYMVYENLLKNVLVLKLFADFFCNIVLIFSRLNESPKIKTLFK